MKYSMTLFRYFVLFFLSGALTAQTANDIIAKNIEIRGGPQKLASIKTLRYFGTFSQQGLKANLVMSFKRPNKILMDLEIGAIKAKIGYDGKMLWKQNPGGTPKEMPIGSDKLIVAFAEYHGFLFASAENKIDCELAGKDLFDGAEVDVVKAIPSAGDKIYCFFDREKHLALGYYVETSGGAKDYFYFRDYREAGGIRLPHSFETRKSNGEITNVRFDRIEGNIDMDEAMFALPQSRSEAKAQGQQTGGPLSEYGYRIPEQVDDGWKTATLTDEGMKTEPLVHLMNNLLNRNDHFIHGIVIIKNGKLIFEEYFSGRDLVVNEETIKKVVSPGGELETRERRFDRATLHFQASVTKSITSLLLGIALDRKLIRGVDEKMSSFFPEYSGFLRGEKNNITLKHMLSMASGIPWTEKYPFNDSRNYVYQLMAADDPIKFVLGLNLIAPPGQAFNYNSGTTDLLGEIIKRVSDTSLENFAKKYLFAPLGITEFQMVNLPKAKEHFFASSGLYLRPRDMAKIGQLVLQEGLWENQRIVSAQWIRESVKQSIVLPSVNSLQYFADGYGFQWWLGAFGEKRMRAYAAAGYGDQFIFILPEKNMVVVLTGGDWDKRSPFLAYDFVINKYILSELDSPQSELDNNLQRCREEIQQGLADEAVGWGEKAIALAPASAEAHFQLALAYGLKSEQRSGLGKLSPARKYKSALEKAVELDPGHLQARNRLFRYLLGAPGIAGGGIDKAKAQAEEIAKLDEKSGYRVRAAIFEKEKKWDLVEKEYKACLALDPKDVDVSALLANFYRSHENSAGAEAVWNDYLAVQPDNLDALLSLGQVRVEMGKYDEAKANFLSGLKASGGDTRFHYQLGRLSALSGRDPEEGISHLQAYLGKNPPPGNPTWADAYWRMGNIYEKTGNKSAAVQAYQKALELNPVHKNAKESLRAQDKK